MSKFKKIAWAVFLAVLILRLTIAFSSPYFEYESYFHIRHIENIKETGLPAYDDPLSYGGGTFFFSPVFHYIVAFFSFIIPLGIIGKVLPNLFYALVIPLTYYISREITGDKKTSLVVPVMVAFMPVLWSNIFTLNPLSVAIPLVFLAFYFLIQKNGKRNINMFLLLAIIAALISPVTIVIVPALWLYILFLKIEKIRERKPLVEVTIFLTFLVLLVQFLLYKNAILVNGLRVIWQNIPNSILSNYFADIGILDVIANVGMLAFLFGLYEIYIFSFEKKEKTPSLFISLVIIVGIFLWAKLVPLQSGMILLGTAISIISIPAIKNFADYFKKTKFKYFKYITLAIIILFLVTSIAPAVYYLDVSRKEMPSNNEISAMLWLKENASERSTVVGSVKDGHLITAVAGRKNVIDSNFLMKQDAKERLEDVSSIYQTKYETSALGLLDKYNAKYIFFGRNVKSRYNVSGLNFEDPECFGERFAEGEVRILKTWCDLE